MAVAFLYIFACAVAIPALPRIVNDIVGSGKITTASSSLYGFVLSTDQLFTFLTVNVWAMLSDRFGRRPFMLLSAVGLGLGFSITSSSRLLPLLFVAAMLDGCTSCMLAIAQAGVSDCVRPGAPLSHAFGLFQGVAVGMAFTIGLPLGGMIGDTTKNYRIPLYIAVAVCVLNSLIIGLFMPEPLPREQRTRKIVWKDVNPLGAAKMAQRTGATAGLVRTYCLLWAAHSGLQANWMNYTAYKFNLSGSSSGMALAMMGIFVAVAPKLVIPRLGVERSITFGLLLYAAAQIAIGAAPSRLPGVAIAGLACTSVGAVAFPAMLASLNAQVGSDERGAMQGAADSGRTLTALAATPILTSLFGYCIRDSAPARLVGTSYYAGAGLALLAWASALTTFRRNKDSMKEAK